VLETTSDAIIGLIAKVFESLVKPKKPVIGEEKESVPTEKKKEVVVEEKEMVKEEVKVKKKDVEEVKEKSNIEKEKTQDENNKIKEKKRIELRGKLIGASCKQYETKDMLQKYEGEKDGLIWTDIEGNPKFVEYLSESDRIKYEIFIGENDGLFYDINGQLIDTRSAYKINAFGAKVPSKAIFVMNDKDEIYLRGYTEVGKFHHSSFLSGDPASAAGEVQMSHGIKGSFDNNSGHYKLPANSVNLIKLELKRRGATLDNISFESINQ
jgi:hypothetical protein